MKKINLGLGILMFALLLTPNSKVLAKESVGNEVAISSEVIAISPVTTTTFTASFINGGDGTKLNCILEDPSIATISPVAYADNVAAFQINYKATGKTVLAVYSADDMSKVAYATILSAPISIESPAKLGTNKDNYFELKDFAFETYEHKFKSYTDFAYKLTITCKCTSYKDKDFKKWGCLGTFYDAQGNGLANAWLFCSSLSEGKECKSEINVPYNAVRLEFEGFE